MSGEETGWSLVILRTNSQIRKNRYTLLFGTDDALVLAAGEMNLDSFKHNPATIATESA